MKTELNTGKAIASVAAMLNDTIEPNEMAAYLRTASQQLMNYGLCHPEELPMSGSDVATLIYYINTMADALHPR